MHNSILSATTSASLFVSNFVQDLPLTGFSLLLAVHDAKLQRNRTQNDWLAYKRKLADIEDQFNFLNADIEDSGSYEENAMLMAALVLEFTEVSEVVADIEDELIEIDSKVAELKSLCKTKGYVPEGGQA